VAVYALVCGSNYVGTRNQLQGCENDVDTTVRLHIELYHQVESLKGTDATRQGILDRLDAAYDQAGPDDLVWFKWSGHGTQVLDIDGDENDPWDEAICPDDSIRHGGPMLTDDDLYTRAAPAHARGVRVIEELDSCFSGEFHRALQLVDDHDVLVQVRFRPPAFHLPPAQVDRAAELWRTAPPRRRLATGALALSACREKQLASEYPVEGKVQGAATYWSTRMLRTMLANGETPTYRAWWQATALAVNDPDQIPVLGGTSSQRRWLVGQPRGRR